MRKSGSDPILLEETAMPKAYWITTYKSISNQDKLAAYAKLAGPAVAAAGGKFIVRGMPVEAWEAGMKQRTVVVEYPRLKQALAAHQSSGYHRALKAVG